MIVLKKLTPTLAAIALCCGLSSPVISSDDQETLRPFWGGEALVSDTDTESGHEVLTLASADNQETALLKPKTVSLQDGSADGAKVGGCSESSAECVEIGKWEVAIGIGLGGRNNPIVGGDNIPILLLPKVTYYGKHFFFETNTLGLTLLDSEAHMINAIATVGFDQIYFNDYGIGNFSLGSGSGSDRSASASFAEQPGPQADDVVAPNEDVINGPGGDGFSDDDRGLGGSGQVDDSPNNDSSRETIDVDDLHDRDIAALAGIEYSLYWRRITTNLQVLKDISSVHNGSEIRFSTTLPFRIGDKTSWSLATGFDWKDKKLLDYYYGIDEDEVENDNNAYHPSSGFSPFLKANWGYALSERWRLKASVHVRRLSREITDSPIVEDSAVTSVFFGGVYHF